MQRDKDQGEAEGGQPREGFSARLDGVALWDLVQLECLSGSRCGVRVQSGKQRGYLFFEDGQLVHAQQGRMVGDAAALTVLSWTRGEITPCELPRPRGRTVTTRWQSLLMQAAQRADERRKRAEVERDSQRSSGVLRLEAVQITDRPKAAGPKTAGKDVSVDEDELDPDVDLEIEWLDAEVMDVPRVARVDPDFPELRGGRAARLDAQGDAVATRGDADELAGQAAYTRRLSDLVGEILALGAVQALEVRARGDGGASRATFISVQEDGGLRVLAPDDAEDATRIRKALEL